MLVYTTPPLEEEVEVTGPITAKLYAATSARDTDWMVRLIDVQPDGYAALLCDGVMRARYRDPEHDGAFNPDKLSDIEPDQVYEYTIDFWRGTGNLCQGAPHPRRDLQQLLPLLPAESQHGRRQRRPGNELCRGGAEDLSHERISFARRAAGDSGEAVNRAGMICPGNCQNLDGRDTPRCFAHPNCCSAFWPDAPYFGGLARIAERRVGKRIGGNGGKQSGFDERMQVVRQSAALDLIEANRQHGLGCFAHREVAK